jgi:acyl-CoA thioester hydrolase
MDWKSLPIHHRAVIPESYLDENNHMNVMWYTHLFDRAVGGFFDAFGFDREYCEANQASSFALEQHTRYLAEVRVGHRVTVRTRALGRSAKRVHFLQFLSIDDTDTLAATAEFIGTHVDMKVRRTSPFPVHLAAAYDRILAEHLRLPWPAPVCGVMKP